MLVEMAEGVGFEPTRPFGLLVFQTSAFDHSATPPLKIEHPGVQPMHQYAQPLKLKCHTTKKGAFQHRYTRPPCQLSGYLAVNDLQDSDCPASAVRFTGNKQVDQAADYKEKNNEGDTNDAVGA